MSAKTRVSKVYDEMFTSVGAQYPSDAMRHLILWDVLFNNISVWMNTYVYMCIYIYIIAG